MGGVGGWVCLCASLPPPEKDVDQLEAGWVVGLELIGQFDLDVNLVTLLQLGHKFSLWVGQTARKEEDHAVKGTNLANQLFMVAKQLLPKSLGVHRWIEVHMVLVDG